MVQVDGAWRCPTSRKTRDAAIGRVATSRGSKGTPARRRATRLAQVSLEAVRPCRQEPARPVGPPAIKLPPPIDLADEQVGEAVEIPEEWLRELADVAGEGGRPGQGLRLGGVDGELGGVCSVETSPVENQIDETVIGPRRVEFGQLVEYLFESDITSSTVGIQ